MPTFVAVQRMGAGSEARRCVAVWLLQPLSIKVVEEMARSVMEDARARRFGRDTRRTGMEVRYYKRVFCEDEVVECSALETLELTAREVLRQKVVRDRVTLFEAKKQAVTACS